VKLAASRTGGACSRPEPRLPDLAPGSSRAVGDCRRFIGRVCSGRRSGVSSEARR
jgi:hypothetical protein